MATIVSTPDRGREWQASKDLKVGDTIVKSKPLAAVLRSEHLSTHCSCCFIPLGYNHDGSEAPEAPLVCEGCSLFTVCSECAKDCQNSGEAARDDVFAVHRNCGECYVLQENEMLDTTTRMLLRLEYARRKQGESDKQSANNGKEEDLLVKLRSLQGIEELEQHKSDQSEESLKTYAEYVRMALSRYRAVSDEGFDLSTSFDNLREICVLKKPDEAVVNTHVSWLQAIQHNQHAITDTRTCPMPRPSHDHSLHEGMPCPFSNRNFCPSACT
jgi:hypothetical protein